MTIIFCFAKFNIKSDVWSFGVVLWEIYTLGNKPYGVEAYEDVKVKLASGHRLEKPEHMDALDGTGAIYNEIMVDCWRNKIGERPHFRQLVEKLDLLMGEDGIREYEEFKITASNCFFPRRS